MPQKKKTVACIIARTSSSRLPLKVLRDITPNCTMLDFIIQRLKKVNLIDAIYICTSKESTDDILEDVALRNDINIYKGSADAVIERLIEVGDIEQCENIIRITGDNVFTSFEHLNEHIDIHNNNNLDYSRITNVPIGATAEVMSLTALKDCYNRIDPSISEYLLLFMFKPAYYKCGVLYLENIKESSNYTLTVDTQDDLSKIKKILSYYQKDSLYITLDDILQIIDTHNIENSKVVFNDYVKMPYGEKITNEEFQIDMKQRILSANKFTIGKR